MYDKAGKESQYIVSRPRPDSDPPFGSDREPRRDVSPLPRPSTSAIFASFPCASNLHNHQLQKHILLIYDAHSPVNAKQKVKKKRFWEPSILPISSCGFFKSSSVRRMSSSIFQYPKKASEP